MPPQTMKVSKYLQPIRVLSVALIAIFVLAMAPKPAEAAEMTGSPYVSCGIGKVNVYPGIVGNYENISMGFQVYKWVWSGSQWTLIAYGNPVYQMAKAIPAGSYNAGYFVAPYKLVAPGFYSVLLTMSWYDSYGRNQQWSRFVTYYKSFTGSVNGSYCLA